MIDKDNIPDKWVLELAINKEDSDLISTYIRSIPGGDHYENDENFPMKYAVHVRNSIYDTSTDSDCIYQDFTLITVEEFKKYILQLEEYKEEIIEEIQDIDQEIIINKQILTLRNDEIIKCRNITNKK